MRTISTETNHVDTLIITVGTRQVGWLCQDGVTRSFGADGNSSYPTHVNELYQELGIERGTYQENDKISPWSARDLGKRYYEYCVEWLGGNFSQVELLLDEEIIETGIKQGLKHIILWGTDQPETVSWSFRRLDTIWLAQLMAGKIKSIFPDIRVDVHVPTINANDSNAIRKELELLVLQEALDYFSPSGDKEFVLWIQNKGCVPTVASSVEICAAALVRQCKVFNASPNEPPEFFTKLENNLITANHSQSFKLIPMGEYFWSLERLRIISAWERGDFFEAQLWLKIHQILHPVLYKLTGFLARYSNWESDSDFFRKLGEWLGSNDVSSLVYSEQIKRWKTQLHKMQSDNITQLWESTIIVELCLYRENYTTAFIQFTQLLERLLYLQSQSQNWVVKGLILNKNNDPSLAELMQGWCKYNNFNQDSKWSKLLYEVRQKRNKIIHQGEFITSRKICSIWANNGFPVTFPETPEIIKNLMMNVLMEISTPPNCDQLLMRSLYQWGLNHLKDAI
ncbi:hypothetical protein FNW02_11270 [Komarekiella sp. 'clone 1']|uniref:Apea-like HEPN domain-containing protein n=1 Tax=Komarekiella delphini-convector SJRDD-AB1 TaxID=2593771 RepID=A0AA40SW44_9NOST|nr:hypothetical protein [Komarekiella delphini-convector]MBD6616398.1 hypothetical protein [Komarekiella delphini-convector SJRDD-AB1]